MLGRCNKWCDRARYDIAYICMRYGTGTRAPYNPPFSKEKKGKSFFIIDFFFKNCPIII